MTKQPGLDTPDALHSVMGRGIDRTNIYFDHGRLGSNVDSKECAGGKQSAVSVIRPGMYPSAYIG